MRNRFLFVLTSFFLVLSGYRASAQLNNIEFEDRLTLDTA